MAVVLRSSSDLIYLPDHGFVGEEGALRVLIQISRQIHRLDISHNLLGTDGCSTLLQGLTSLRARFNAQDRHQGGLWGLREINLGCNALDDQALEGVLSYAKKDVWLAKLLLQANAIELRLNLPSIIHSINSSHLRSLSLTNNPTLSPPHLSALLRSLSSPNLTELYLSACALPSSITPALVYYLSSPVSRCLELLELNGNRLNASAITSIVDCIETRNCTIKHLGLLANGVSESDTEGETSPEERSKEDRILSYQVHTRLPPLLERNRILTKRTRRAALRALTPGRLILTARPLSDEETARQVLETVGERVPHRPFPLLDLPREVVYNIVRHSSGDAPALSEAQFGRLLKELEDPASLARATVTVTQRTKGVVRDHVELAARMHSIKEEWLRKGGWDKWELDTSLGPIDIGEEGDHDLAVESLDEIR